MANGKNNLENRVDVRHDMSSRIRRTKNQGRVPDEKCS